MVILKELSNNYVTLQLDYKTVCTLHNLLCKAEKEKTNYDTLSLEFTNIFEMLKHGFITDLGIYKNAKYFREHDSFEHWEGKQVTSKLEEDAE